MYLCVRCLNFKRIQGDLDSQRLLIAGHGVYFLWALSCRWNDNLLFWSQALHNYFKSRLIRLWRWISAISFPPCNSSSPSTHFSLGIHTLVSKTSTEILNFILSVVDIIQMSLYFVKYVCGLQTFWEIYYKISFIFYLSVYEGLEQYQQRFLGLGLRTWLLLSQPYTSLHWLVDSWLVIEAKDGYHWMEVNSIPDDLWQDESGCTIFSNATACRDGDGCKGTKAWTSYCSDLVFLTLEGFIHSETDTTS